MSVRNNHVRQSDKYVYKTIGEVMYQFSPAPFVYMSKVRYAAKKAVDGKLSLNPELKYVEVQEDGTIKQS